MTPQQKYLAGLKKKGLRPFVGGAISAGGIILPPVPVLIYPAGVLAAQPNWNAKSVYDLQLPGATGSRVSASALRVPNSTNLPSGWSLQAYPGSSTVSRLVPSQGANPLTGCDLSRFPIYPPDGSTISGIEISDCLFGDGFDQSGAGSNTAWVRGSVGWNIHHNTVQLSGVDKNMNHWLTFGQGSQVYRNKLSGFPDDPISANGGADKTLSLVYENYLYDPIVPAGNHTDFFNIDGGNLKIYRNLCRVTDLVKYAGFNNFIRSEPNGSTVYGIEAYNNVAEGWTQTDNIIQMVQSGAGSQNINVHDNVINKPLSGNYFYTNGSGGFTNSSGNIDTVTGIAVTEFPVASQPVNTTRGTISSAVVGTAVTISGENWNVSNAATYYQWVSVDANGVYTLLPNGGNATYTPVAADVGKTIGRITLYQSRSSGPLLVTAALTNTAVVTAS